MVLCSLFYSLTFHHLKDTLLHLLLPRYYELSVKKINIKGHFHLRLKCALESERVGRRAVVGNATIG